MNSVIYNSSSSIDWVAISAGVVALCALFVSLWDAYSGRQHNKLSSRPLLEFYSYTTSSQGICLLVKNCGPGPAIIRSILITYNKTKYNISDLNAFQKLVDLWHQDGLPESKFIAASPHSHAIVASGDGLDIFRVTESENTNNAAVFFVNAFRNMIVEISYEGLYKEPYSARYEQDTFHSA